MVLSTVPLSQRGLVATPAALFAVLCAASHLPATEPSDCHQIPAGSLGYVHVQVTELDESPLFDTVRRLQNHIQTEASAFSLSRIGLDATKLSEVTFLFPSFDTCMRLQGDHQPYFVLIATLSEAFQPERFANRLSAELGAENLGSLVHGPLSAQSGHREWPDSVYAVLCFIFLL